MKLVRIAGLVVTSSILLAAAACADAGTDIPEGSGDPNQQTNTTIPVPPAGSTSSSTSSSSTSSSGSTSGSSSGGSTSSTSSSSGGSSVPACTFGSDLAKLLSKLQEIQTAGPCDSSCNPTTHCCLDLLGGGGGSSGFPGGSSGLPGFDGGPGGSSGLPGGGAGLCVSK